MSRDDRELSDAFKAEATRIAVPPRSRGRRRSDWTLPVSLVASAALIVVALTVGRALGELRGSTSAATAAPPPSPSASATPQATATSLLSDRYGLIIDRRPPTLISEAQAATITELRGDFFRGAVSPDGRKIAYWETYSAPAARTLWLLDTSEPAQPRALITLPDAETAAVSTGSAVAWSSDGSGLLIAVNSVALAREPPPPDAPPYEGGPLYSTLRQLDIADGSVREIVRFEAVAGWFSPVAWDRARGISTAAVVGPGGFASGYIVLQDGAAPGGGRLPSQTLTLAGYVRAAPDASAVLMRGFPEHQEVYVWPLGEPTKVRTLSAADDEYVAAAMWRNAREIVVSLSRTSEGDGGDRLEVWTVDGSRRVLLAAPHRLAAVRPDGSAAITDRGAVDLESGAVEDIPGTGRALAAVLLR